MGPLQIVSNLYHKKKLKYRNVHGGLCIIQHRLEMFNVGMRLEIVQFYCRYM